MGHSKDDSANATQDISTGDTELQQLNANIPKRNLRGASWVAVVCSVLAPFFLFALDNTIVADVQPKIVEAFGDVQKLPWVSVAFALGAVSVNLIWWVPSYTIPSVGHL